MNRKKANHSLSLKEQIIMFFFGIVFVTILGRQYFANLGGSVEDKSRLMKVYYLGLLFWFVVIGVIFFLENHGLFS